MSDARNADKAVNLRGDPALLSGCGSPRVAARMNDVAFKLTAINDA